MTTELQLRSYQAEALAAIHASDKTRQLVSLPTGSGKTVLFAAVARDRGPKALIIAHRTELISQAAEKLEHFYPGEVGILQAGRQDLGSPVLVASIQTAMQHIPALSLRRDRTLIIDEAHHVAANTYRKLAQSLGFMINHPGRLLLGVTATPSRGDGIGLDCVFEQITYQKSIVELMADGYLADLRGIHIKTHSNLIGVSEVAGDFSVGELARKINTPERNTIIVDSMFKFGRVPAVAFCADIQHSLDLAQALSDNGYRTATVTGKTPKDERADILKALASGDLDIVTNCNVLTEGFDCSALRCLIMARPTKSETLYTQMIGRGTRLHPGKTEALVLEFNDNRPDIMDISTLAGKPIKEGESLKESILRAEKEMEDQAKEEITGVTYHPFQVVDFNSKSARLPGLDPDGLARNQAILASMSEDGTTQRQSIDRTKKERQARYKESRARLEILLLPAILERFNTLPGLEDATHQERFIALMDNYELALAQSKEGQERLSNQTLEPERYNIKQIAQKLFGNKNQESSIRLWAKEYSIPSELTERERLFDAGIIDVFKQIKEMKSIRPYVSHREIQVKVDHFLGRTSTKDTDNQDLSYPRKSFNSGSLFRIALT